MSKKKIKYCVMQSLIGGMALGAEQAIGNKPEFLIDYDGFQGHSSHLRNYWPEVPHFIINADNSFQKKEDEALFNKLKENMQIVVSTPICA